MRFEIDFNRSPEYVYIQTDGEASVRGFDALLTALVGSPGWRTGTRQLVDHSKLVLLRLSAEDMQSIRDIAKKHSMQLGNGRCAFVASDALGFGLARMYELLGGADLHEGIAVFYTVDEAAAWLRS